MNTGLDTIKKDSRFTGLPDYIGNIKVIESQKDYDLYHAETANDALADELRRKNTLLVINMPEGQRLDIKNENALLTNKTSVKSEGSSLVIAKDSSFVLAKDTSRVISLDNASILASDRCTVNAKDNSYAYIKDDVMAIGMDNSAVITNTDSRLGLKNNTKVVLKQNSICIADANNNTEIITKNNNLILKGNSHEDFIRNTELLVKHTMEKYLKHDGYSMDYQNNCERALINNRQLNTEPGKKFDETAVLQDIINKTHVKAIHEYSASQQHENKTNLIPEKVKPKISFSVFCKNIASGVHAKVKQEQNTAPKVSHKTREKESAYER
jgi:hypothetical protein